MRKFLFGVIITFLVLFSFKYCGNKKTETIVLKENSTLIQNYIQNVGKLVVTEGHFSEVFSYENSKAIFGDLVNAEKKALVVVNAEVSIAYNLSEIEYHIDEATKILEITNIPKEELKISPDLEYYDVQADFLNPFEAEDYNNIKETINASLMKKIEASEFKKNAKNRLISELSKFYILTNSLGWTLIFNSNLITNVDEIKL